MTRYLRYFPSLKKESISTQKYQFAQQHALRAYKSNSIYSFIPKNACSTMRLSLTKYNGCINDTSSYDWVRQGNIPLFQADLASLACADYTFVILRCPYSRLASAFLDKIVGYEVPAKKMYSDLHGKNFMQKVLKNIKPLNKFYFNNSKDYIESLSFMEFVKIISHDELLRSNRHWTPQVDFLIYEEYDDWFCIENFSRAINTLKNRIDLDVVDARRLTFHGKDYLKLIKGESFSNLPCCNISEMKENGECPDPYSLYNDQLVEIVGQIYADDISLYKSLFGSSNLMFS